MTNHTVGSPGLISGTAVLNAWDAFLEIISWPSSSGCGPGIYILTIPNILMH